MVRSARRILVAALPLLMLAPPGAADEVDDVLGAFDELGEEAPEPESAIAAERFWDLTGSVSVGSSINYLEHEAFKGIGETTDYQGVQRLRTRLNLELDLELPWDWQARIAGYGFYDWAYRINGRSEYRSSVLNKYEWEVDFQEVWIQGSPFEDYDFKLGRQIVNWGRSDSLRVLDVLNPLDNREPGLTDIEDIRRPVTMVKNDWYLGRWSVSMIAIPEMRFDFNPPIGSDFAAVTSSLGTAEAFFFNTSKPDESVGNTEWGVAVNGIFSGWDVSFYFARHWQNSPYLEPVFAILPPPAPGAPPGFSLDGTRLKHSRLTMVGAGGNYTKGSWLFKAEIAWIDGVDYTTSTRFDLAAIGGVGMIDVPTGSVEKSRLDFMGGVEYYGFNNTNIAIEVVNRHIFGFRKDMRPLFETEENRLETAIRITRNFLNERLELTALGIILGNHAQDGSVVRLEARYDLRDALEVGGGVVFYQKGDPPPFDSIKSNDRLFFEVKYSF